MSFILDALRKSEHAREGRALPGLVDLPAVRTSRSRLPLVLTIVGALLALNLVILMVVLLRRPEAPPATGTVPAPAAASTASAPAPARSAGKPAARTVRPLGQEASNIGVDAPPPTRPTAPPPGLTASGHVVSRLGTSTPGATTPSKGAQGVPARAAPAVPTLNDLPAQVTSGLPHINIDLHVWNADPAQRWVVLNGQRLKEGADMKEGPHLEQITADGVILDFHGTHFLLPRQ
jgi:general secretion pathway protein B